MATREKEISLIVHQLNRMLTLLDCTTPGRQSLHSRLEEICEDYDKFNTFVLDLEDITTFAADALDDESSEQLVDLAGG